MQKETGDSYSCITVDKPHAPMQVGDGSEAQFMQRGAGCGIVLTQPPMHVGEGSEAHCMQKTAGFSSSAAVREARLHFSQQVVVGASAHEWQYGRTIKSVSDLPGADLEQAPMHVGDGSDEHCMHMVDTSDVSENINVTNLG